MWAPYEPRLKDKPYYVSDSNPKEVRINLAVKLRDRQTMKYFHFDVGNIIGVFSNEYALSVDLRSVLEGGDIPELPYVDGVGGLDFGGVVVPWKDGEKVHVGF